MGTVVRRAALTGARRAGRPTAAMADILKVSGNGCGVVEGAIMGIARRLRCDKNERKDEARRKR